jgi:hypothetical protein
VTVKIKVDDAAQKRALALLKEDRKALTIGVLPEDAVDKHPTADATIGEIALWSEYGTDTQPARSWLFDWVDAKEDEILNQLAADTYRAIFEEEEEAKLLEKRGKTYIRQINARIKRIIPPPNRPATLRRKNGTTPLIDTKVFLQSIKFKVD